MPRLVAPMISVALFAFADVAPGVAPEFPGLGPVANISAVAVLAWWAWSLQAELREERKSREVSQESLRASHAAVVDKLCERSDAWEKIRHADSEKLSDALRDLSSTCAKKQAQMARQDQK